MALIAGGCNYGFQGGGGFPSHIRTIYVEPFENETVYFDLEQQLFTALVDELPRALGVRPGGRESADAVVRGRIVRYDDVAQNYRAGEAGAGTEVLTHRVRIGVAVEIIDVENDVVLWETSSVTGEGTYAPTTESDEQGRMEAIEEIVEKVVTGAQSQW